MSDPAFAQSPKTKTYKGPYDGGTAQYTYYENPTTMERVFHGKFSSESDDGTVKASASGAYTDGKKTGTWTYRRSASGADGNRFFTMDLTHKGSYAAGRPDGVWTLSGKLKGSEGVRKLTGKYSASISFDKGTVSGAVKYVEDMSDGSGVSVKGQTTSDGLMDGRWTIKYPTDDDRIEEIREYQRGFLVRVTKRSDQSGKVLSNLNDETITKRLAELQNPDGGGPKYRVADDRYWFNDASATSSILGLADGDEHIWQVFSPFCGKESVVCNDCSGFATLRFEPTTAEGIVEEGDRQRDQGKRDVAKGLYEKALATDRTYQPAKLRLAMLLAGLNHTDSDGEAVKWFEEVELAGLDDKAINQYLELLDRRGSRRDAAQQAIDGYRRFLAIDPSRCEIVQRMCAVMVRAEQIPQALKELRSASACPEATTAADSIEATAAFASKNYDDAIMFGRTALAMRPQWGAGYTLLMRSYMQAAMLDSAVAVAKASMSCAGCSGLDAKFREYITLLDDARNERWDNIDVSRWERDLQNMETEDGVRVIVALGLRLKAHYMQEEVKLKEYKGPAWSLPEDRVLEAKSAACEKFKFALKVDPANAVAKKEAENLKCDCYSCPATGVSRPTKSGNVYGK